MTEACNCISKIEARLMRPPSTLAGLKRQAKKLSRETGCKHTDALERMARSIGFPTYLAAKTALEDGGAK